MQDASLLDLNSRFLELLASPVWHDERVSGPARRVAALPRERRLAAANCPYALFDMRFEDEEFWVTRLQAVPLMRVADEPALSRETIDFARTALFYAWHVAGSKDKSAQLKLGMSECTATAFASTTVELMPMLAAAEAANLAPRWSSCHTYWSALAGAAERDDAMVLRRVQLYGLQLSPAARIPRSQ